MHKRILLFTCIALTSCFKKVPNDVLSTQKMTEILTDIQLADVAYKMGLLPSNYTNHPEKYYLEILASHETDSAVYHKSLHYYAENPKLLKKIYLDVEKNIQLDKHP